MARCDIDNKELIKLVKERPALYNPVLPGYTNVRVHDALWNEVAERLNISEKYCRQKWVNLRNSYARYLRCKRNAKPSQSCKIAKYYLADSMAFLHPYMIKRKSSGIRVKKIYFDEAEDSFEVGTKQDLDDDEHENVVIVLDDISDNETTSLNSVSDSSVFTEVNTSDQYNDKISTNGQSEIIPSQSMVAATKTHEDAFVDFAKSLVIDYSHLSMKRQRKFKQRVLAILNELLDEQESEMN